MSDEPSVQDAPIARNEISVCSVSSCKSPLYAQRAGHDVRLLVVTRFIRLHPGAQKGNAANYWSLFEPHYKQNLYANPKRTAKSSFYISDASAPIFVQIIFPQSRIPFFPVALKEQFPFCRHNHRSHRNVGQSSGAIIFRTKIF
jgi:hypothetical protein